MQKSHVHPMGAFCTRALVLAFAASLPLAAAAQDTPRDIDLAALQELDDDRTDLRHEGFTIDEIEDMNLVRDGDVIGEVEAVLADTSGQVVALVVEYEDGFAGLGDKEAVVPIDELEFDAERREVTTRLSDEQLAALPTWDD